MTIYSVGSGGDFANLQAAESALGAGDHELHLLAGDAGDCVFSNSAYSSLIVKPSSGCGVADVCIDAGNSGIAYIASNWGTAINREGITLEGFRIEGGAIGEWANGPTQVEFKNMQFVNGGINPWPGYAHAMDWKADGCAFFGTSYLTFAVAGIVGSVASQVAYKRCSLSPLGLLYVTANMGHTVNATLEDIAVFGDSGFDSIMLHAVLGTLNLSLANLAAEDASPNASLTNQVAADWFVDPASDLRLKIGSPGLGAGVSGGNIGAYQGTGV